jgi:hypothetical protein
MQEDSNRRRQFKAGENNKTIGWKWLPGGGAIELQKRTALAKRRDHLGHQFVEGIHAYGGSGAESDPQLPG